MQNQRGPQGWEEINESEEPEYFVQTLSQITGMEFAQAYKRRSHQLLGLKRGDAVLDVGCGLGEDVIAMAHLVGSPGRAVGIDLSQEMVIRAQQKAAELGLTQAEFRQGSVLTLPFPNQTFRGCRADRVLQHLTDRESAIQEMVRVLKPGGRLIAIDPDWETLVFDISDKAFTRKICACICDGVTNGWAGHQSPRLFAEAGLLHIAVLPITAILTELGQAKAALEMDRHLKEATLKGALTAEEHDHWYSLVEERQATGQFFASMGGFMVLGNKPL